MRPFARAVAALTFSVSALTTTLALADEAPPPPEAPKATPLSVRPSKPLALAEAPSGSRMGTALAALAVLIGGGVWIARRRSIASKIGRERTIHIAARRAIGVRSELLVVEVDGHPLLLGVTPGAIQRLAVLPDAIGERIEADADESLDVEPGFQIPTSGPREPEREREPMTVPEPRRPPPPRPISPLSDRRGPRARDSLPLEEQVRGLMRDRRAS